MCKVSRVVTLELTVEPGELHQRVVDMLTRARSNIFHRGDQVGIRPSYRFVADWNIARVVLDITISPVDV